jgi:hypothetical protein
MLIPNLEPSIFESTNGYQILHPMILQSAVDKKTET